MPAVNARSLIRCSVPGRYEYQNRLVKDDFIDTAGGANGTELTRLDGPLLNSVWLEYPFWCTLLIGTEALLNKAAPTYSNIIQAVISDSLRVVYVSAIKNTLRSELFSKRPEIRLLKLPPFGSHNQHI
jgi:hypothetical protein